MSQIFGSYANDIPSTKQYVTIVFAPLTLPVRWSNIGLSADFIAQYFEAYFPEVDSEATEATSPHEIRHSISYIANELMENAVKFNYDKSIEISLTVSLGANELIFVACNSVEAIRLASLQVFIKKLLSKDPGELLIQRIEENFANEGPNKPSGSGLGLLTIMNDYKAKIGWKLEEVLDRPDLALVTTMVRLGFSL